MESIRHAINESSSLVVIDGSEISGDAHQCDEVGRPKIIVLDDINNSCTSKVHQALLTCREYTLFDHNPMRAGYCIFEWIGADRLHEPENSLPQQSFPEIDEAEPSYRVQEYGGTA
jgi:hypothetical protein